MPLNPALRWQLIGPLLAVLGWDALGLDLPLAHWSGTAQGFALRDQWFLSAVLHNGARDLGWVALLALTVCIARPVGVLKALSRRERAWMVGCIWLSILTISLIKGMSTTSCPWDLQAFGGQARWVSHWAWGMSDGGGGHCFPAGHASTGFAFLAGYAWLRPVRPQAARWWLAATLAAGVVLGMAQQIRGAHFASHTLWTAWLCWACALLLHHWSRRPSAKPAG